MSTIIFRIMNLRKL